MRAQFPLLLILALAACSEDNTGEEHVWQDQTEAIRKAEDVNQLMMDTDTQRREAIDRQSR